MKQIINNHVRFTLIKYNLIKFFLASVLIISLGCSNIFYQVEVKSQMEKINLSYI